MVEGIHVKRSGCEDMLKMSEETSTKTPKTVAELRKRRKMARDRLSQRESRGL